MTLEEHYKLNYRKLSNLAYRRLGEDHHAAEDVVQETYSRALLYENSFNPALSSYNTWVSTIFNRCLKDFQRAERIAGSYVELEEHHLIEEDKVGENNKTLNEILREINKLRGVSKHICFLYFIKGYTPKEIVHVTDAPNNSVRKTVQRFKNKMRSKYEKTEGSA